jgi:hypothetical protein
VAPSEACAVSRLREVLVPRCCPRDQNAHHLPCRDCNAFIPSPMASLHGIAGGSTKLYCCLVPDDTWIRLDCHVHHATDPGVLQALVSSHHISQRAPSKYRVTVSNGCPLVFLGKKVISAPAGPVPGRTGVPYPHGHALAS